MPSLGQITEEVLCRLEEANITVILVQGGWTSHLWPLDLTVMANFKEASSFLGEWMTEQMRKREEKLKKSKQKADRNFKARLRKGRVQRELLNPNPCQNG